MLYVICIIYLYSHNNVNGKKIFFQIVANLQNIFSILTEKNPYLSEPVQFKLMLFNGQQYLLHSRSCVECWDYKDKYDPCILGIYPNMEESCLNG